MNNANFSSLNESIMKKFEIDRVNKVIMMPRALVKKASQYGTEEYKILSMFQEMYPAYEIKIRAPQQKKSANKKDTLKGLTYEYMEKYISVKGSEEQKETYVMLRNPKHDDGLEGKKQSYAAIRNWFLNEFSEVLDYQKKIEQILARKAS